MSQYSFIAADYELAELDNSKSKIITVREAIELGIEPHELIPWEEIDQDDEVLIFDEEEDLYELVIRKEDESYDDVGWYTEKPFIYAVEFQYTDKRGRDFLHYLKENTKKGHSLEVFNIWLGDRQEIRRSFKNISNVSIEDIEGLFNHNNDFTYHRCLVIE